MQKELNCEGPSCQWYRKYYDVVETRPGSKYYTPVFNSTDERCKHPDKMKFVGNINITDQIGARLVSFSKCPKNK
jgi:hypothetical protein